MKTLYFKTLAEFKRLATRGTYVRGGYYGKYQDEWRKIAGVQSNAVKLATEGRGIVYFDFPKAKNCELLDTDDGTVLKIFEDRVKYGDNDIPAGITWLKYELERGAVKESDLTRYRKQVAEYRLGVEE